jgi:hypothetical protein
MHHASSLSGPSGNPSTSRAPSVCSVLLSGLFVYFASDIVPLLTWLSEAELLVDGKKGHHRARVRRLVAVPKCSRPSLTESATLVFLPQSSRSVPCGCREGRPADTKRHQPRGRGHEHPWGSQSRRTPPGSSPAPSLLRAPPRFLGVFGGIDLETANSYAQR